MTGIATAWLQLGMPEYQDLLQLCIAVALFVTRESCYFVDFIWFAGRLCHSEEQSLLQWFLNAAIVVCYLAVIHFI